jgi:hypothetical protein
MLYTIIRGDDGTIDIVRDGRWDSKFGEVLLDDTTVPGYGFGDVRFIQYAKYGWSNPASNSVTPSDEQANPSMSGNMLFGGHWALGYALNITNREASLGLFTNPIRSEPLPQFVNTTGQVPFSASHYSPTTIALDYLGEWRPIPYGFYIYHNSRLTGGQVYDQYWSEYAAWVVSNNTVYFVSTDGAVVALENGNP